ncbi:MAG: hypothetical protein AAB575_03520 [Patescibacteria group bacterium]
MKGFYQAITILCLVAFTVVVTGCGENKTICLKEGCHTFVQYGFFNEEDRNPNVQYQVVTWNVIWGIVLVETVVMPIVLFGWSLYEPVGPTAESIPGALGSQSNR